MPAIVEHWKKEKISFDAIYTGYLGSIKQVEIVKDILNTMGKEKCVKVVDPAFADHGKLYSIFDMDYVNAMKTLCPCCDILVPNLSEACFLSGIEYKENYDEQYILQILIRLTALGCKTILMTGISFNKEKTGILLYDNGKILRYEHEKMPKGAHGTGDIYASAFVGALLKGKKPIKAGSIAADFTVECIKNTQSDKKHWYGAKFETALPYLMQLLGNK
jgi:pyridoxine kinase